MKGFFNLIPENTFYNITFLEKFIPILLTILIIIFIPFKKSFLKNNDRVIRYIFIFVSSTPLFIYYLIEWTSNGIKANNLPLHLCFYSNILAIILCFNKSKKIFNILIYAGVLGGISSLIAPTLNLSWLYFRYYQFMICHISIIIIPIYFAFIHNYKVNLKDTIKVFLSIEFIGIALGIFNEIFKTNYMFISYSSNFASNGSILSFLGEDFYFLKLQIIYISIVIIWFLILKLFYLFNQFINIKTHHKSI